jgi:hypothetical protein
VYGPPGELPHLPRRLDAGVMDPDRSRDDGEFPTAAREENDGAVSALIGILKLLVALPLASETITEKLNGPPAVVGLPEIVPVADMRNPAGSAPLEMLNVPEAHPDVRTV